MAGVRASHARPLALTVIVVYKLAKAPLMFGVALWLTLMPTEALHEASSIAEELAEGGIVWSHLGQWLSSQLSASVLSKAAILAAVDGVISAAEGILLLAGHSWGEWLVILGIATLIPFELSSLLRKVSGVKVFVIVVNVLMVAYLVYRRTALGRLKRSP